jgi:GT2 family glycosyltransferase
MASAAQADAAVIYSPVVPFDQSANQFDKPGKLADDDYLALIRWGSLNTGGLLLRRDAVLDVGGWNPEQECCQEHELLLRLRLAGKRFHLHNEALAVYRIHSSETVSRRDPLLTIRTRMNLTDRLVNYLEGLGEMTQVRREALFAARIECARSAFRLDPILAKELSEKADALGRIWVTGSPALPFSYQLALRVAGFANAERLAALVRR